MDFGAAEAELDHGVIYTPVGGSEEHARTAFNILRRSVRACVAPAVAPTFGI
jgi:hypothetical protein